MPPKDMNKPAQCQVPGCSQTKRIGKHVDTGIYACGACRKRYAYKGSFDYAEKAERAAVCSKCHRATQPHLMGVDGVCLACRKYYAMHGTYERTQIRRTTGMGEPMCQQCRSRNLTHRNSSYRGGKWLCLRCAKYYKRHKRHRPRWIDATHCVNCNRPLERGTNAYGGKGLCRTCSGYKHRFGKARPAEMIQKQAPHGWCECGKPAEVQIDLRTGGLLVVPTKAGMTDYLTGTREEYAEWVCRECAGYEAEMQRHGGNTYEPSSYIKRG